MGNTEVEERVLALKLHSSPAPPAPQLPTCTSTYKHKTLSFVPVNAPRYIKAIERDFQAGIPKLCCASMWVGPEAQERIRNSVSVLISSLASRI